MTKDMRCITYQKWGESMTCPQCEGKDVGETLYHECEEPLTMYKCHECGCEFLIITEGSEDATGINRITA